MSVLIPTMIGKHHLKLDMPGEFSNKVLQKCLTTTQSVGQISTKIPNPFIAGMVYWLFLILVVGICVAGTGILAILIEIKVIELYKKNCWDVITLLMILTSTAVIIYFGEAIKKALSVNLLLLFVLSQGVYLGIRCYLKNRLGTKQYW